MLIYFNWGNFHSYVPNGKTRKRASSHYPRDFEERHDKTEEIFFLKGTTVCMKILIVARISMVLQRKIVRQSLRLISIITKHFTPMKNSKHMKRCQSCSLDRRKEKKKKKRECVRVGAVLQRLSVDKSVYYRSDSVLNSLR